MWRAKRGRITVNQPLAENVHDRDMRGTRSVNDNEVARGIRVQLYVRGQGGAHHPGWGRCENIVPIHYPGVAPSHSVNRITNSIRRKVPAGPE